MAKKNGKKKKKGDGKKGKNEAELPQTEWDDLNLEELEDVVADMTKSLEKIQHERNRAQIERDSVQSYRDVTAEKIREVEMLLEQMDINVESTADEQDVEMKVYEHKVRHIEYEHLIQAGEIEDEKDRLEKEASIKHIEQMEHVKKRRELTRQELKEREIAYVASIDENRKRYREEIDNIARKLELDLEEFRQRCQRRQLELQQDIELQQTVEEREVEERCHSHMADLNEGHEKAREKTKAYFCEILRDGLDTISNLQGEVKRFKETSERNAKTMENIREENDRLSGPLKETSSKVAKIRSEMKHKEKDRLSLRNTKARLLVAQDGIEATKEEFDKLKKSFDAIQKERNELHNRFDETVVNACLPSNEKNDLLEEKLCNLSHSIHSTEIQLSNAAAAAGMDESEVYELSSTLGDLLTEKNKNIEKLRSSITQAEREYNELLNSCQTKLRALGIPDEDLSLLGEEFAHTSAQHDFW